jgi:hypothetical protein
LVLQTYHDSSFGTLVESRACRDFEIAELTMPSMMVVSDPLCEFCDSFRFGTLSFHESEPGCEGEYEAGCIKAEFERSLWKRKLKAEAEEILDATNVDRYGAEYQRI